LNKSRNSSLFGFDDFNRTVTKHLYFPTPATKRFCCISEDHRKKQSLHSTTEELLADKVVRTF